MAAQPPYFPTPFVFDQVMAWLGENIDGNPYEYSYTSVPTDAASYAANITWVDYRTQPTWAYITPGGAGWALYNNFYQVSVDIPFGTGDSALAQFLTNNQPNWTATGSSPGVILNKPSLSTVATSGAYSDLTGKPMLAMVATSGSYNDLSNKPAARSQSVTSRSLSSGFQVSTTQDALVMYSISLVASISLTTGQSETMSLQISPNNTTYTTVGADTNGNTGTLTIGLALVQTVGFQVMGFVPAGYYAKLVPSGTGSAVYVTGQEVLL